MSKEIKHGWKTTARTIVRRLDGQYQKPYEWAVHAELIAKANGGYLPNPQAMLKVGLWALYQAMRRHPDEFKGIKTSRKNKRILV